MEPTNDNLQQQLKSLSDRHSQLGQELSQAAIALGKSGTPVGEPLLQALVKYNRDFASLQQKLQSRGQPTAGQAISIAVLEELYQNIARPAGGGVASQKAIALLDRVLALTHGDQPDFAPLQKAQEQARQLKQKLAIAPAPEAEALAENRHPLAILLTLLDSAQTLDDERWAALAETVETAFGKALAVAISRGKITPPSTPPVERKTVNPDIVILEEPGSTATPPEVIIVPSVEVPQKPPTIDGKNIVFGNAPIAGKAGDTAQTGLSSVGLRVRVYLHGLGDRDFGAREYAGTRGQGRRLEAFQIAIDPPIPGLDVRYMAYISGVGDTPKVSGGQRVGEPGKNRQIEGFCVELAGPQAANYDICYNAHIQNKGDVPVCANGQYCGTRGQSLRVEGIKVWVQPKR
ncbi:MAG: hydrogenase [Limnospira sp.]